MPNRCGCANACSCLIVAGDGIAVEGIGTLENPYEITSESSDLVGRIEFTDEGNVDFTTTGVGTLNDPLTVFADAVLATSDLTDVPDTEASDGDLLVWRLGGWVYEQPAEQGASLPPGGTDGQVLTKQSSTDGDALWETLPAGGGGGGAVVEPVYASSRRHNAATAIPNSTITAIPFDTLDYEDGIPWNGADFVIPVAGYYQINAVATTNTMATGGPTLRMTINGSASVGGLTNQSPGAVSGSNGPTVHLHRTVKLAVGDLVHVSVSQISGSASALAGGAASNWMNITKVPANQPAGGGVVVERPASAMRQHLASTGILNNTLTAIAFDTEKHTEGITWDAVNAAFVVPEDGYYDVEAGVSFVTNATGQRTIYIQVNNVSQVAQTSGVGDQSVSAAVTVKALAGQLIKILTNQGSGATLALNGNALYNYASVTKVPAAYSGSAVSTYGERNYMGSRRHNAATSIPNLTFTPVPFDTVGPLEGLTWNGTGFVCPVAGYYEVDVNITYASNATGQRYAGIGVNGTVVHTTIEPAGTGLIGVQASATILCAAGDVISGQAYQASGAALALYGNYNYNHLTVHKVPAPVVNGAAASGVWGTAPLDTYGSNDLVGREVYIDSMAQLRARPEEVSGKKPTDLSPTWPAGTSIFYIPNADAALWPGGSLVVTHKTINNVIAQWCYLWSAATTKSWYRNGTSTAWSPWVTVAEDSGWVNFTSALTSGFARYRNFNGTVHIQVDGGGTTVSGTILTINTVALPAALRPTANVRSGGYFGGHPGSITMDTAGNVSVLQQSGANRTSIAGYLSYLVG